MVYEPVVDDGNASHYVAPLSCGLDIRVKGSRYGSLRKPPASFRTPGQYPIPHTSEMIYVAHIYLVPPCTKVYVFK